MTRSARTSERRGPGQIAGMQDARLRPHGCVRALRWLMLAVVSARAHAFVLVHAGCRVLPSHTSALPRSRLPVSSLLQPGVCLSVCVCVCVCVLTCIHTHTYTHTHACMIVRNTLT